MQTIIGVRFKKAGKIYYFGPGNLEINQGEIRFFNAGDALDLANKTIDLAIRPCLRPSRQELLYRGDANLQRLGNAICEFLCAMPNGGV